MTEIFLNGVVTDIISLQEQKLVYFKGNYDNFEYGRNLLKKQQEKAIKIQEKKKRKYKKNRTRTHVTKKKKKKEKNPLKQSSKKNFV